MDERRLADPCGLGPSLAPSAAVLRFEWSGRNTSLARIDAGRDLADHVRQVSADYPQVRHVVVAHSHGGNVALYALRDIPEPHPELVALATPFIYGQPREIQEFTWFLIRTIYYVSGVTFLVLIVLYLESLIDGTLGAWFIGAESQWTLGYRCSTAGL